MQQKLYSFCKVPYKERTPWSSVDTISSPTTNFFLKGISFKEKEKFIFGKKTLQPFFKAEGFFSKRNVEKFFCSVTGLQLPTSNACKALWKVGSKK